MDSTIQQFQDKIEELKKRLKAISTTQNTLSKIDALLEYFNSIQRYLEQINKVFTQHMQESEDYFANLDDINLSIQQIQEQIENLPSFDDLNLNQMQSDISTLQSDLSTLKGSSNSTIEEFDEQIQSLNANLSTLNTQLEALSSGVSTNTADISNLKTTTTNHATTLNNLSSSQTTLTNSVANINSRLNGVEANVSTLTGGVDVSEIDNRITKLENKTIRLNPCFQLKKDYGITSNSLNTQYFYFYADSTNPVTHFCKLKYTSSGVGTLTIKMFEEYRERETIQIDLVSHPAEIDFSFFYMPNINLSRFKFEFYCTEEITYKSIIINSNGVGVLYTNLFPEVEVHCFDNKQFITKRMATGISYGCFSVGDEINLNALPNTFNYDYTDGNNYLSALYLPCTTYDETTKTFTGYYDGIVADRTTSRAFYLPLDTVNTTEENHERFEVYGDNVGGYCCGVCKVPARIYVDTASNGVMSKEFDSSSASACFSMAQYIFATLAKNNNQTIGSTYAERAKKCYGVALRYDGYFWFKDQANSEYIRIDQPNCVFATMYTQPDGSYNVYLTDLKNTYKYKIQLIGGEYIISHITTINNCDCIYETYNNTILKHNIFSNNWTFATLEY